MQVGLERAPHQDGAGDLYRLTLTDDQGEIRTQALFRGEHLQVIAQQALAHLDQPDLAEQVEGGPLGHDQLMDLARDGTP